MLISELIEQLLDIQADHPDAEVRLAMQPSWPLEYSIHSITSAHLENDRGEEVPVVYLSEGVQLGYLPRAARDAAW